MVTPIVTYPSVALTTRVPEAGVGCDVGGIVEDMLDTMYTLGAAGLAANQVGYGVRVVVVDERCFTGDRPLVLVDPVVVSVGGREVEGVEACLSVPDVVAVVPRRLDVVVDAYDASGTRIRIDCRGNPTLGRVVLHELDHLDGVTMLDRALTTAHV